MRCCVIRLRYWGRRVARFDWVAFLRRHRIPYVTDGPNCSRDHVNIKCVFCGQSDHSEHLGISLKGKGWHCWRNAAHKGRSNAKLVQAILKCSYEEAVQITGGEKPLPGQTSVADQLRGMLRSPHNSVAAPERIALPASFKRLLEPDRFGEQFWGYLRERGYRDQHIRWLAENYDLRYTVRGNFAYRLIIPITDRQGRLKSWTGRSINPKEKKRYDTVRVWRPDLKAPEQPYGLLPSNSLLLGLPLLWNCPNPKVLIICEGPFDAFRVSVTGHALGVYGTCLFGLNFTPAQQALVSDLAVRFPKRRLIIDPGEALQALRIASKSSGLVSIRMPGDAKDLDELTPTEVFTLCWKLAA